MRGRKYEEGSIPVRENSEVPYLAVEKGVRKLFLPRVGGGDGNVSGKRENSRSQR